MIPPNPELSHVATARKRLEAMRPPDDTEDYDALQEAVEVLCTDVESFDKRHRMHQEEQRESSKKVAELREALQRATYICQNLIGQVGEFTGVISPDGQKEDDFIRESLYTETEIWIKLIKPG